MRTDEEIEAQLDALVEGDSNDEEIDTLRDIVDELLDDRRRLRSSFDNDEEVRVANGEHLGGDRG